MRGSVKAVTLAVLCLPFLAADWRQFRGSDSTGIGSGEAVPLPFGPKQNLAWQTDLPGRGLSSPVLVGERVFLTASSGHKQDRLHVLAFDARTGRRLWQRTVWATGPTTSHPKTCMAAPTPASDGQHVVALFATNDLVCLDLDGNVRWIRSLHDENPGATDGRGLASSPLVIGATVIVHVENQNTSFASGIDIATGKNRWRQERPRELNWSSPIAIPGKTPDERLALLQGSNKLSACDPLTGREVWTIEQKWHPIASSVLTGTTLLAAGAEKLIAYALPPDGSPPKVLWEQAKLTPATASPVVLDGRIYMMRGPILTVGDLKTGEVLGQLRLKGSFSASLVTAGGLIMCVNEEGIAHVVKPGDKDPVLVESCPFEEAILCTPAATDGMLYVRSDKHLWKIGKS